MTKTTNQIDRLAPILLGVLKSLPTQTLAQLNAFWNQKPAIDPFTLAEYPAPQFLLVKGWAKTFADPDVIILASIADGRLVVFDLEFVSEAPAVVVATLIARALGHIFRFATGMPTKSERNTNAEVNKMTTKWGYRDRLINGWLDAKDANPENPLGEFYGYFPKLYAQIVACDTHPTEAGKPTKTNAPQPRVAKSKGNQMPRVRKGGQNSGPDGLDNHKNQ
jgi:hypothetical protein